MGYKIFPCTDIRGDQAKPRWTRWPLHPIGLLLPKGFHRLYGDVRRALWGCQLNGVVVLDPRLLKGS